MATFVSARLEFQGLLVLNTFKKYIFNKICCGVLNLHACVVIIYHLKESECLYLLWQLCSFFPLSALENMVAVK